MFTLFFLFATCVAALNKPEQIHLSFGDTPDSMAVMWSSRINAVWMVLYGESRDTQDSMANASMAILPDTHIKAAKFVYRAILKNLTYPSCFYKIVCRNDSVCQDSDKFMFRSRASMVAMQTLTRYVVYGDMGAKKSGPTLAAIKELSSTSDVQAILHVGDLGYDLNSDGGMVGDMFMNKIQPIAARIPYLTSPGNHEIPENFTPYRIRFSTPGTDWPIPLNKMWYSFDQGFAHIISYSTEVYFTDEEGHVCEQFYWLLDDLISANKNRDKRPWIIAVGHRPMYCSNTDGDDCTDAFMRRWVKDGLEALFHAQGVDLIIQAHEHSYERLFPVFDGTVERFNFVNPRAPVHVISGAAGSIEGTNAINEAAKDWSAFRSGKPSFNSFGILEIHNATHIHFSQHDARDNESLDDFWMVQEQHGPFVQHVDCKGPRPHGSCVCNLPLIHFRIIISIISVTGGILVLVGMVLVMRLMIKRCQKNEFAPNICKKINNKTKMYLCEEIMNPLLE